MNHPSFTLLEQRTIREINGEADAVIEGSRAGFDEQLYARVASDPAGNTKLVKPDRMKESKRIDSIVAMVMALDVMTRLQPMNLDDFFQNPLIEE